MVDQEKDNPKAKAAEEGARPARPAKKSKMRFRQDGLRRSTRGQRALQRFENDRSASPPSTAQHQDKKTRLSFPSEDSGTEFHQQRAVLDHQGQDAAEELEERL